MSYWNIKFYDGMDEQETVRHLTAAQKDAIMAAMDREGAHAMAMQMSESGRSMVDSHTVNRDGARERMLERADTAQSRTDANTNNGDN